MKWWQPSGRGRWWMEGSWWLYWVTALSISFSVLNHRFLPPGLPPPHQDREDLATLPHKVSASLSQPHFLDPIQYTEGLLDKWGWQRHRQACDGGRNDGRQSANVPLWSVISNNWGVCRIIMVITPSIILKATSLYKQVDHEHEATLSHMDNFVTKTWWQQKVRSN